MVWFRRGGDLKFSESVKNRWKNEAVRRLLITDCTSDTKINALKIANSEPNFSSILAEVIDASLVQGFRKGRSCEHALLAAQNTWLTFTLSRNEVALLLLIDFSKAFDIRY